MAAVRRFVRHHSVGLLALAVALGGTSYAAVRLPANSVGPQQLKRNSVTSAKVGNGQIKAADLARGAVGTAAVTDGSLLGSDFRAGEIPAGAPGAQGERGPAGPQGATGNTGATGPSTGAAGGDLTGSFPNPAIATNAVTGAKIFDGTIGSADIGFGSVTSEEIDDDTIEGSDVAPNALSGSDIAENTLSGVDAGTVGGIGPSGLAGIGRGMTSGVTCFDDDHTVGGEVCGSQNITLPRAARLLIILQGRALVNGLDDQAGPGMDTDSTAAVSMTCTIRIDGSTTSGGAIDLGYLDSQADWWTHTVVTVSSSAAGSHTITNRCSETDGDIDVTGARLMVIALAAD
jgi:hypothetical protein